MKNFYFRFYIVCLTILLAIYFSSCNKIKDGDETYGARDVFVGIKSEYTVNEVFNFINLFDHKAEEILFLKFVSDLPPDSLQYVLDYLSIKEYLTKDRDDVYGYNHYETNQICIFPTMWDMHKKEYQEDWLSCMEELQLHEDTSTSTTTKCAILFIVPWHREKFWVEKFLEYEIVKYAELNYYSLIEYQ